MQFKSIKNKFFLLEVNTNTEKLKHFYFNIVFCINQACQGESKSQLQACKLTMYQRNRYQI